MRQWVVPIFPRGGCGLGPCAQVMDLSVAFVEKVLQVVGLLLGGIAVPRHPQESPRASGTSVGWSNVSVVNAK